MWSYDMMVEGENNPRELASDLYIHTHTCTLVHMHTQTHTTTMHC